jgi:glycosyltransferase involved in cell wall biosynthesis
MHSICLVMIVKNEAAVIRRCLDSVKGLIQHWVICDTGSTDGTQQLIRETLTDIPGALHESAWVDFGHNRSESLRLARGKGDYFLLIDADMMVNCHEALPKLTADSYLIRCEGPFDYHIDRLVSARHEWRYIGATHEYVHSHTAKTREKLPAWTVTHFEDGGTRPEKYQRDLKLLKAEVEARPEDSRAVFYLAQTYRDMGNLAQSMEWYEQRAAMGGWDEEIWYSLYQVGVIRERLGFATVLVQDAFLAAYEFRPGRMEPLFRLTCLYRRQNRPHVALLYARAMKSAVYPADLLFIERDVYDYRLWLEYAWCCEQLGKIGEARTAFEKVLHSESAPVEIREKAKAALAG